MSWTRPADLQAQVQRLWDRGDLPRALCQPAAMTWPLRLTLKRPSSTDMAERFDTVRGWVQALASAPGIRLDWREVAHRVQGRQRMPDAAYVDSLEAALALIDRTGDAARIAALWRQTEAVQPGLLPWLADNALRVLALEPVWPRLLAVVAWMQAHPRPGLYLRQLEVPGVDTKFIEAHQATLRHLLALALPPEAIAADATGFAARFGFLDKPVRLRFRLLDPELLPLPGWHGLSDITLTAACFAALDLPLCDVIVTENETNFLALPPRPGTMAIFGAGYGWEALSQARWLQHLPVHYWGDIDTHGFHILDRLRAHLPHVASLLMDEATLLRHRLHWTHEPQPVRTALTRLTDAEAALYKALCEDRFAPGLRLEQERIGFSHVQNALASLRAQ